MSMKERDREKFLAKQQAQKDARPVAQPQSNRKRYKLSALELNAKLVYEYDRDFPETD